VFAEGQSPDELGLQPRVEFEALTGGVGLIRCRRQFDGAVALEDAHQVAGVLCGRAMSGVVRSEFDR